MGPLCHLVEREERVDALREARRILRPGGRILAEVIGRHSWVLDATKRGLLDDPNTWMDIGRSVSTGMSQDPNDVADGGER